MGKTKLEERGRVVIPKEIRRKLGLSPGAELDVSAEGGAIVIRQKHGLSNLKELRGCITPDNAREKVEPLDVKTIWRM